MTICPCHQPIGDTHYRFKLLSAEGGLELAWEAGDAKALNS